MYPNMNSGQRQEFVSRLTTASVAMHWQASTKKTISESAMSQLKLGVPSAFLEFLSLSRRATDSSSASPTL